MLRSGNDAEALGTHSTSVADVRKKYKEAATMLHPDKQHGRDEASRRRTAMAWQRWRISTSAAVELWRALAWFLWLPK